MNRQEIIKIITQGIYDLKQSEDDEEGFKIPIDDYHLFAEIVSSLNGDDLEINLELHNGFGNIVEAAIVDYEDDEEIRNAVEYLINCI